MRYVPVEEARKQLGKLIREAAAGRPVTIGRHGTEQAVLLSGDEYERLRRAEEEASKARFMEAIEDIHRAVQEAGLTPDVVREAIAWARAEQPKEERPNEAPGDAPR
ncbi:MAG TPA: type II toxin-antitoxin system Phd/YefM family antitoxin [Actinomycetota bacterium]